MARRGRGGQGNKGRGKKNRGPGKSRKKRVSRKPKNRVNKKPRSISKSTRRKIASDRRKKRLSKIKNKSLKNRINSLGLGRTKTDTNKKQKRFSSLRDAFNKIKKGFTIGGQAYANAAKNVANSFKGAAANASNINTKPKSKLQSQISNFKNRWQAMSTPEAKRERMRKRLYNQHGLDYSRMRDGMTIKINPKQWLGGFEKWSAKPGDMMPTVRTGWLRDRIPKALSGNWINHTLKSPTKLGPRDGWHRGQYNSTGKGRFPIDIPMRDMMMRPEDWERQKQQEATERQYEYDKRAYEMSKDQLSRSRDRMGPQQDWLSSLYSSHNISGGKLDREARDYWSNEAKTKGRDAVMQSIIGTSKAQGTYGGRKKPKHLNLQAKGGKRRMAKSLAARMASIRGGIG